MLIAVSLLNANLPLRGPFAQVRSATFSYNQLDASDPAIDVVWPDDPTGQRRFPLISYAHGWSCLANASYGQLFEGLASWGYVVAATRSCRFGCTAMCSDPRDLLSSFPPGCRTFASYYMEQLRVIEWSRTSADARQLPINVSAGAAVAGHSMGGQAAHFAAAWSGAAAYGVRAAVIHDPAVARDALGQPLAIRDVPFLVIAGANDTMGGVPPSTAGAESIFTAVPASASTPSRGIVIRAHANHLEPMDRGPHVELGRDDRWMSENYRRAPWLRHIPEVRLGMHNAGGGNAPVFGASGYRPELALYMAAWFKVHLDAEDLMQYNSSLALDFRALLTGDGPQSLCGGGDGEVTLCEVWMDPASTTSTTGGRKHNDSVPGHTPSSDWGPPWPPLDQGSAEVAGAVLVWKLRLQMLLAGSLLLAVLCAAGCLIRCCVRRRARRGRRAQDKRAATEAIRELSLGEMSLAAASSTTDAGAGEDDGRDSPLPMDMRLNDAATAAMEVDGRAA